MDYSQHTGDIRRTPLVDNRRYSRQAGPGSYRSGRAPSRQGSYPLKSRNIRFKGKRSAGLTRFGGNTRTIIMAVLGLVLVVLLFFLVSSCVRSCRSNTPVASDADARVSASLSDELIEEYTVALDQAQALEWIAANADQYPSEDLPRLALEEPAAIPFVRAYPESPKTASAYGDSVTRGEVPMLFNWDARWGAVEYDESVLAVTGSGPTSLAMAYMGITGKNDKTPADLATTAKENGMAGGEAHTSSDLFTSLADELGLSVHQYEPSRDTLTEVLDSGTVIIVEVRAETLTDYAHWAVVAYENENGSVRVYDPTSVSVSRRPWDPATIASASINMLAVSMAETVEE